MSAAVNLLKKAQPAKIIAISLIAAPEGGRRMPVSDFLNARRLL